MSEPAAHPLAGAEAYRQWVACARKRAYGSRKIAKHHATMALKNRGHRLGIYCCDYCGKWHLYTLR